MFDDIFSRLDTIHERDGRRVRQTDSGRDMSLQQSWRLYRKMKIKMGDSNDCT